VYRKLKLNANPPLAVSSARIVPPCAAMILRRQIDAAHFNALAVRSDTARSGTIALLGAGWTASDEP